MLRFRRLCLLLIALALWTTHAAAHPHVWIGTGLSFVVAKGKVTGVRFEWAFDEFFSSILFEDYDANRNGKFEANEVQTLKAKAFARTGEQDWLARIKAGERIFKKLTPMDFEVEVRKKEVVYRFLLPLPEPVDPKTTPLSVAYYEESYYIEMLPQKKDPARFEGDGSLSCRFKIDEDKSVKFYFNSVSPMRVSLQC